MFTKPRLIHRRGTRLQQPAANAVGVGEGTLYYVTDEGVLERSNGTTWQSYSTGGTGTITGALTSPRVPYATGAHVLADNAAFNWDDANTRLFVPTIVGGTGTTSDLILQATSGVGTTGSWIFFKVGNNGAVTAVEINDVGGVGIGTTGLVTVDTALVVRKANPPDIGYVAKFISNLTAYLQVRSGSGANEQAGVSFYQATNNFEWRVAAIGNDGNALRFGAGTGGTDVKAYLTQNGNLILDSTRAEPSTGTKTLVLGDGTVPATLGANTAALYANADTDGVVNLFGINEAGESVQITGSRYIVTTTGNIDDLDFRGAKVIIMNNASLSTIRGLLAGYDGQQVWIISKGAGEVDCNHQDTNSAAANRLINNVTIGPTPAAPATGSFCYTYDAVTQRWRLTHHNQGAFIAIPFSAGDFTANGAMTWTVASGDVAADLFRIEGKTITWLFRYNTTTVGGTPNSTLIKAVPNGYNFLGNGFEQVIYIQDNGTAGSGRAFNNSTTTMGFLITPAANWAASTDLTKVSGTVVAGLQ